MEEIVEYDTDNLEIDDGHLEKKIVRKYKPREKKVVILDGCCDSGVAAVPDIPPDVPVTKVKKPRTDAQIAAFEKARATRDANRSKSKELKDKQIEEKVLTKVLKEKVIKKKDTKLSKLKSELINQIIESDSDEESVAPVAIVHRRKSVAVPVKPRITFV